MRIGEYQELAVARESPHGFYLADSYQEVLLPRGQVPSGLRIGDRLRVFVLTDSEDRPIATTKVPYATVGEFAKLRVVSETSVGAFLDWGIDKDLLCPFSEQQFRMEPGREYLVRVYLDQKSHRVVCTTKFGRFLTSDGEGLSPGQPVKIVVAVKTPEMVGVIIGGRIRGRLFPDEWHEELQVGDVRDGFVKSVRGEDNKVAVSLRPQGFVAVMGKREQVLRELEKCGGTLDLSDRSSPAEIQKRFGMSKSAFKKLIGTLYKEGVIEIREDRILFTR